MRIVSNRCDGHAGETQGEQQASPPIKGRHGNHMKHATRIAALAAAAAPVLAGSAAVAAPAGTSHCPPDVSGYISWEVTTQPYQADNRVDRNGNGLVCARPTNKTFEKDGVTYTLYNFIDDVLR
jgi:hypothetical protein